MDEAQKVVGMWFQESMPWPLRGISQVPAMWVGDFLLSANLAIFFRHPLFLSSCLRYRKFMMIGRAQVFEMMLKFGESVSRATGISSYNPKGVDECGSTINVDELLSSGAR